MKRTLFLILFLAIVVPVGWVLFCKYEGDAPTANIFLPSQYLKQSYEIDMTATDKGSGLQHVTVCLVQNDNEKILLDKSYPPSTILSLFSDKKILSDTFSIPVETRKYGMSDGQAVIRISVTDYAWRNWTKGNCFNEERPVIIDTVPPRLQVLTSQHNVSKGGAGLVVYKIDEDNVQSGVRVGDNFFPGYSGVFDDPKVITALFALDSSQGPDTRIVVEARDSAGNETKRGFYHYIKDKNFRIDTLTISDSFLEFKMPDFDLGAHEAQFLVEENPLLAKFLYINETLRRQNVETVLKVPSDTSGQLMWQGRFNRLSGAANRAGFADKRTYKYNGKVVSHSTHSGIDLASTSNAPVGAANDGRVIMAENVGIFGNTVIIDHGLGLASLYAHLSQMNVSKGDMVKQDDIIGRSGLTGLAGGDHLHFSMIIHNVFTNPVEWWDPAWIKNNITSKIESVKAQIQ
ncbi:M23 family metallopeptidase [uncultured Desulfobacter sp.]|uniref:M23 family metallopeptidase n=1 Tax=uncultured Desulfobacter sp. TaxID=240139 RepID=UPI002AABB86B|nr:M23 family metallopeptidase [uncultured Desulfobacter sp.]